VRGCQKLKIEDLISEKLKKRFVELGDIFSIVDVVNTKFRNTLLIDVKISST